MVLMKMSNDLSSNIGLITLLPKCGRCCDFLKNNHRSMKSILLVPHVIKYRNESQIITWRCNWGNTCESGCIFAMTKEKNELTLADATVNTFSG